MKYENWKPGFFLERPNRFIATVRCEGKLYTAHVKNTGRCRELLIPGCRVGLSFSDQPQRKTPCDLIMTDKVTAGGIKKVNFDSQAPNRLVMEFLEQGRGAELFPNLKSWKQEVTTGDSRLDFCLYDDRGPIWMEVKGCTLEENGLCYFPDAPTLRGTKHLQNLTEKALNGERAAVFFVIQMSDVLAIYPNRKTDPAFADALAAAKNAGVSLFAYACAVTDDTIDITVPVPVMLA